MSKSPIKNSKKDPKPDNLPTSTNRYKSDYHVKLSAAPGIGDDTPWFQMLPIIFFTSIIIMITRLANYERPMSQFYWSSSSDALVDFFSYYKMVGILICAGLTVILLLYRLFAQSFYLRKSYANIAILIYAFFVLLSYVFSDYKVFALYGWADRFEGTMTLLSYMIMLFYIFHSINSEKSLKLMIYSIAGSSTLLGLLGLTQALDHDFFRTTIGKKLITPSWFWDRLDTLNFTFQNKEIYQTVYNINYVSFYLTLLLPIFGLIFARSILKGKEEPLWKKAIFGFVYILLLFNMVGSASSGGIMGLFVTVVLGLVVLNKRLIEWKKAVLILLALTLIVGVATFNRFSPEMIKTMRSVLGMNKAATQVQQGESTASTRSYIDYIDTTGQAIIISLNGNPIKFETNAEDPSSIAIKDADNNAINATLVTSPSTFKIDDPRFEMITLAPAKDDQGNHFDVITIDSQQFPFQLTNNGPLYFNGLGKLVDLDPVPSALFKNLEFGSGRGYIWSRTIPMIKDTLLIGHGADTYCIYFPHKDYAGKYNAEWNINTIVDKPHNMYLGMIIGTGLISFLALLSLWVYYFIDCVRLYFRKCKFESFASFCGVGIFLGVMGFLTTGLVDDSSVSVMPLFYGLLGAGLAVNRLIANEIKE